MTSINMNQLSNNAGKTCLKKNVYVILEILLPNCGLILTSADLQDSEIKLHVVGPTFYMPLTHVNLLSKKIEKNTLISAGDSNCHSCLYLKQENEAASPSILSLSYCAFSSSRGSIYLLALRNFQLETILP